MLRPLLGLVLLCSAGCMPQGGGPSPRALLVISSETYSLEQVAGTLDDLGPTLDVKVNKKLETIKVGDKDIPQYQQYEVAYWFPQAGSDTYGVALVKWVSDLKGEEAPKIVNRYFVDVYSEDEECALCKVVESAFEARGIAFFSACEHPDQSSKHEQLRCGT